MRFYYLMLDSMTLIIIQSSVFFVKYFWRFLFIRSSGFGLMYLSLSNFNKKNIFQLIFQFGTLTITTTRTRPTTRTRTQTRTSPRAWATPKTRHIKSSKTRSQPLTQASTPGQLTSTAPPGGEHPTTNLATLSGCLALATLFEGRVTASLVRSH